MLPLFDGDEDVMAALDVLHGIKGWPVEVETDVHLLREWKRLYPSLSLHEEAVAYLAWLSERKIRRVKHRARFANWLRNAIRFRSERSDREDRGHRNAEDEGFGDHPRVVRDW